MKKLFVFSFLFFVFFTTKAQSSLDLFLNQEEKTLIITNLYDQKKTVFVEDGVSFDLEIKANQVKLKGDFFFKLPNGSIQKDSIIVEESCLMTLLYDPTQNYFFLNIKLRENSMIILLNSYYEP